MVMQWGSDKNKVTRTSSAFFHFTSKAQVFGVHRPARLAPGVGWTVGTVPGLLRWSLQRADRHSQRLAQEPRRGAGLNFWDFALWENPDFLPPNSHGRWLEVENAWKLCTCRAAEHESVCAWVCKMTRVRCSFWDLLGPVERSASSSSLSLVAGMASYLVPWTMDSEISTATPHPPLNFATWPFSTGAWHMTTSTWTWHRPAWYLVPGQQVWGSDRGLDPRWNVLGTANASWPHSKLSWVILIFMIHEERIGLT